MLSTGRSCGSRAPSQHPSGPRLRSVAVSVLTPAFHLDGLSVPRPDRVFDLSEGFLRRRSLRALPWKATTASGRARRKSFARFFREPRIRAEVLDGHEGRFREAFLEIHPTPVPPPPQERSARARPSVPVACPAPDDAVVTGAAGVDDFGACAARAVAPSEMGQHHRCPRRRPFVVHRERGCRKRKCEDRAADEESAPNHQFPRHNHQLPLITGRLPASRSRRPSRSRRGWQGT